MDKAPVFGTGFMEVRFLPGAQFIVKYQLYGGVSRAAQASPCGGDFGGFDSRTPPPMIDPQLTNIIDNWELPIGNNLLEQISQMVRPALISGYFGQ